MQHRPALDLTRGPALDTADVATVRAAVWDAAPDCSLVALDVGDGRRRCYVRSGECLVAVESAELSAVGDAVERVRRLARQCADRGRA